MSDTKEQMELEIKVGLFVKHLSAPPRRLSHEDKKSHIKNALAWISREHLDSISQQERIIRKALREKTQLAGTNSGGTTKDDMERYEHV